ncbi:hypothetical protein AB1Y20_001510 [Prymnesium parvum]|uniref:Protein kinase domain-containing protein n=1 Tax=Prymnesium parvum TaxID=97485 RepID=A0AB34K8E3_PRYPA
MSAPLGKSATRRTLQSSGRFTGSVTDLLQHMPDEDFVSGCLLLRDCARGDMPRIRKRLADDSELLNFKDYDRRTALHVSASEGHLNCVSMLLDLGANPNLSDRWGGSPLDDAQRHRHVAIAELLRKHGGRGGVNDLGAALIVAASSGNATLVAELIEDGANVNSIDYDRRTPIHLAASEGHPEVVRVLIERGGNVNCEDRWGGTPLDDAIRKGNTDCVAHLEKAGASSNKRLPSRRPSQLAPAAATSASSMEADWADVTVLEKIGAGAFGEIYKCRWRGTLIAAKTMLTHDSAHESAREEAMEDFRREINFLADLRHPNICMLLGYSTTEKHEMMLAELMKCSLLDVMKAFAGTPFSAERTARYAIQFAQGMTFLHTCKPPILHRDLKPANLLLDYSDTLKVSDFGLAKLRPPLNSTEVSQPYKMTGETGSYRFMAPEVYRHEDYALPVDVYSFAMIIYYMVAGEPPFADVDGERAVQLAAVEHARPTIPRSVDILLQELVRAAWDDNPAVRPSFTAILEQLNEYHLHEFKMTFEERMMQKKPTTQASSCACTLI